MNQPHILADMNEASSVVMKFIGTETARDIKTASDAVFIKP